MIETLGLAWLTQDVTLPLWAYTCILLLPAAYFAKAGKELIAKRVNKNVPETRD